MDIQNYIDAKGNSRTDVQIARLDTKEKIIDISDVFSIREHPENGLEVFDKLKLTACAYSKDGGKPSLTIQHYIQLDLFLMLCTDILVNVARTDVSDGNKPYSVEEFKGKPDPKSPTGFTSSKLTVRYWAEGGNGAGAYTIELQTGPGQRNATGAVMPDPAHESKKIKMIASIPQARRFFAFCKSYIDAKMVLLLTRYNKQLFSYSPPVQAREPVAA